MQKNESYLKATCVGFTDDEEMKYFYSEDKECTFYIAMVEGCKPKFKDFDKKNFNKVRNILLKSRRIISSTHESYEVSTVRVAKLYEKHEKYPVKKYVRIEDKKLPIGPLFDIANIIGDDRITICTSILDDDNVYILGEYGLAVLPVQHTKHRIKKEFYQEMR